MAQWDSPEHMEWLADCIPLQDQNGRAFAVIRIILHNDGMHHTGHNIANGD